MGASERGQAVIKVVLAAFLNGAIPILGKLAYQEGLSVLTLLSLRFIIAALFVLFYDKIFVKIEKVDFKNMIFMFGLGFISYTLGPFTFFKALEYTSAFIVEIIFYTYPALVLLFVALLFKEKITRDDIAALTLALAGLLMIFSNARSDWKVEVFGTLFALIASLCYAIFNVASQKMLNRFKPDTITAYSLLSAAIYYSPFLFCYDFNLTIHGVVIVAFLAILATFLPLILYLSGMEALGASKASIISTIEPVFTLILATLILKEILGFHQLMGGFMILTSIVLLSIRKK